AQPSPHVASGSCRELLGNCLGNREEGGDDVKSAWPLRPGLQTCYNGRQTKGSETARWRQSQKSAPSSDRRLQLACVKLESLVTADQLSCGEYVPGPCTHRPSRHLSCLHPKSVAQPAREGAAEGVGSERDEVVTR